MIVSSIIMFMGTTASCSFNQHVLEENRVNNLRKIHETILSMPAVTDKGIQEMPVFSYVIRHMDEIAVSLEAIDGINVRQAYAVRRPAGAKTDSQEYVVEELFYLKKVKYILTSDGSIFVFREGMPCPL